MEEVGDVPKEVPGNQRCEDNSCSAARYSPSSSNLLREMVKGTEQSCYTQAEVILGSVKEPGLIALWNLQPRPYTGVCKGAGIDCVMVGKQGPT